MTRAGPHARGAAVPLARARVGEATWPTRSAAARTSSSRRSAELREHYAEGRRASCCARSPAASRSPPTRRPSRPCAGCWRKPRTPPLTPGAGRVPGDRRLPAAGLAAGDRAHPRRQLRLGDGHAGGARPDRGDAAARSSARSSTARRRCSRSCSACDSLDDLPDVARFDPTPEEEEGCATGCCGPARRAASRRATACSAARRPAGRRPRRCRGPRVRRTVAAQPALLERAPGTRRSRRATSPRRRRRSGCTGSG